MMERRPLSEFRPPVPEAITPRPLRRPDAEVDARMQHHSQRGRSLTKPLLFGAALTAFGGLTMHEGTEYELHRRDEAVRRQHQEEVDRVGAQTRAERIRGLTQRIDFLERISRERAQLIERSRQELQEQRFDLGEFFLESSRLDALQDEGRALDVEAARDELHRLYERFSTKLTSLGAPADSGKILAALEYAVEDYEYHGVDGLNLIDALLEQAAQCSITSELLTAILWHSGYQSAVAMRFYAPAPGQRFAHQTAILLTRGPHGRIEEIDMMSGGDPYRDRRGNLQGLRVAIPELVDAYERFHLQHTDTPEEANESPINANGAASSGEFATGSDLVGEHLSFAVPPTSVGEAFPDVSPAISAGIMQLYVSTHGRIREHQHPEDQSGSQYTQLMTGEVYINNYLNAITNAPTVDAFGSGRVATTLGNDPEHELARARMMARKLDQIDALLHVERVPARKAIMCAISATVWQQLADHFLTTNKPRSAQHAQHLYEQRMHELSRALENLTVDDLLHELRGSGSGRRHNMALGVFRWEFASLIIDNERGWPLVFETVKQGLARTSQPTASDNYFHTAISPLICASAGERRTQIWELIRHFSLAERAYIFKPLASATLALDESRELDREVRLARVVYSQNNANVERLTGVQHELVSQITFDEEGHHNPEHIQRVEPVWHSFQELQAWVAQHVRTSRVDPRWESMSVFIILEDVALAVANSISITFTGEERLAIQRVLNEAGNWLTMNTVALQEMGVTRSRVEYVSRRGGTTP